MPFRTGYLYVRPHAKLPRRALATNAYLPQLSCPNEPWGIALRKVRSALRAMDSWDADVGAFCS